MKLRRTSNLILRAVDEESSKMKFSGYALKFNQPTVIKGWCGDFTEEIDRSAFDTADISDVVFNFNHDMSDLLARTTNGSLVLTVDDIGLKVDGEIIDTALGRDVYKMIQEGLITKMSFQTEVIEDKWNEDAQKRTLTGFGKFFDVSAVTFPAYEETEILAQRDADSLLQEHFDKGEGKMKIKRKENIKDEESKTEEVENTEEVKEHEDEEIERGKTDKLEEENKKLKEENEELKKKIKDLDDDQEDDEDEDEKEKSKSKEKRENDLTKQVLMRGAMGEMNLKQKNVYNTVEYRDAFFEKLRGGSVSEEKYGKEVVRAINTKDNPGKMFVPQIFIDEIVEQIKEYSIMGICKPMKEKGIVTVPLEKNVTGAKLSTEDGTAPDPMTVEIISQVLTPQRITAIVEMTKETEKLSLSGFIDYLKDKVVEICVEKLNYQILNGEADDGISGILNAGDDYVTKISVPEEQLAKAGFQAKAKIKYKKQPYVVMNQTFFDSNINTLTATDGTPIYTKINEKGDPQPYYCHMPVKLVDMNILAEDASDTTKPAMVIGTYDTSYWLNMPFDMEEPERNMAKSAEGFVRYIADLYASGKVCNLKSFCVVTMSA